MKYSYVAGLYCLEVFQTKKVYAFFSHKERTTFVKEYLRTGM